MNSKQDEQGIPEMVSITTIVLGIPITPKISRLTSQLTHNGFKLLFHAGFGQTVGYCGVELGQFHDCNDCVKYDFIGQKLTHVLGKTQKVISLKPTKEQFEHATQLVDKIDPKLKKLCPEFGVYFIHSTS